LNTLHIVMIVLLIIGIPALGMLLVSGGLGFLAFQEADRQQNEAESRVVEVMVSSLENACDLYKVDNGEYPLALENLFQRPENIPASEWNGPYLSEDQIPRDPWGNEFHYQNDGDTVHIWSAGPDGDVTSTDDNLGNDPMRLP